MTGRGGKAMVGAVVVALALQCAPALAADPPAAAYTLGPGDVLAVSVLSVPTLSTPRALVLADGTVSLPVVGTLRVRGLTLDQATALIDRAYARTVRIPEATAMLLEPRPFAVTVLGQVAHPGRYATPGRAPGLLEVLGMAGNLLPRANRGHLHVLRSDGTRLDVNLEGYLGQAGAAQLPELRDGDTVVVDEVAGPDWGTVVPLAISSITLFVSLYGAFRH